MNILIYSVSKRIPAKSAKLLVLKYIPKQLFSCHHFMLYNAYIYVLICKLYVYMYICDSLNAVHNLLMKSLIACSTGGSASGDDNNSGAIVGGVLGGLCGAILLILLIILIWFYWKRKRGEKSSRASMEHMCV